LERAADCAPDQNEEIILALPLYQVDAFTDRPFAGNLAAVVPFDLWLDVSLMQSIGT
jgi:predicted PhzF superfamily epimerase YddE/YHI9